MLRPRLWLLVPFDLEARLLEAAFGYLSQNFFDGFSTVTLLLLFDFLLLVMFLSNSLVNGIFMTFEFLFELSASLY